MPDSKIKKKNPQQKLFLEEKKMTTQTDSKMFLTQTDSRELLHLETQLCWATISTPDLALG